MFSFSKHAKGSDVASNALIGAVGAPPTGKSANKPKSGHGAPVTAQDESWGDEARMESAIDLSRGVTSNRAPESAVKKPAAEPGELMRHIFDAHDDSLVRFLKCRLRNAEDVQDVSQEVYLRVVRYQGLADIRHPDRFLIAVAKNVLCDLARHQKTRNADQHVSIDQVVIRSSQADAETALVSKQCLGIMAEALSELPVACRKALLLHRIGDLSYQEVADKMGLSYGGVRKLVSRASGYCRSKIDQATC